jgi:hypothetical protein
MEVFSNQNSIFIELGVFETRLITNFNSQSILINRFSDDRIKKIYPVDYNGKFSSYENLKLFFAYLFSLIENPSFISRFLGFKVYILVDVDTQVESEAIHDSVNTQNVRAVNLITRKQLSSFSNDRNLIVNIDVNGCDVIDTKSSETPSISDFNYEMVDLYNLAINYMNTKYINTISADESSLKIFNFHKNSVMVFEDDFHNEFIERVRLELEKNIFAPIRDLIDSSVSNGSLELIFTGDFFSNQDLSKLFKAFFKRYEINVERSPTFLLEYLRNSVTSKKNSK